jgi:hypothetical protein
LRAREREEKDPQKSDAFGQMPDRDCPPSTAITAPLTRLACIEQMEATTLACGAHKFVSDGRLAIVEVAKAISFDDRSLANPCEHQDRDKAIGCEP